MSLYLPRFISAIEILWANRLPRTVLPTEVNHKRDTKVEKKRLVIGIGFAMVGLFAPPLVRAQIPMQSTDTYAAKFICGGQTNSDISANPYPDVQAGRYSTKINLHNNTGVTIRFRKKIIPLTGGEHPTSPPPTAIFPNEVLAEDQAMEVVCQDVYGYLGIKPPPQGDPWHYIEGFVIFEVYFFSGGGKPIVPPPDPLDVEGVYTYKGDLLGGLNTNASGVSIAVVVFPAKHNSHILH